MRGEERRRGTLAVVIGKIDGRDLQVGRGFFFLKKKKK